MLLKSKLEKIKKSLATDNVLANLEERYCYSTDASNNKNELEIPDLVVFVETVDDVQKVLKYANKYKIPIIPRGAGTNMVGSCACNSGGIILNFSKMNKILDINVENMYVKVQPGVVLADLKESVKQFNFFFPPDPSNYKVSTIGGGIAQSSGGALSFKYGTIKDYIISLTVVTAEGKLLKLGTDTTKSTMGYHLNQLIVGSEGTLAVVVEATLRLIPKPEAVSLLVAGFANMNELLELVNKILSANLFPATIDFMDKKSILVSENYLKTNLNIEANYILIVQFDGDLKILQAQKDKINSISSTTKNVFYKYYNNEADIQQMWEFRRVSYAATTRLAPDVISDDIIVPRSRIVEMVNTIENIVEKYKLKMCLVGHIGDGNLHPQIALNLDKEDEFRNYVSAKSEIYNKAIELGGCISAEHGIGLDKLEYLPNILSEEVLNYMRMIKQIFDPNNILNPGKIFKKM